MRLQTRRSVGRRRDANGNRRGATLVMVAVVISVLTMFAAMGIDFARMYAFSAQLKTLTDAAALAAAVELRNDGTETDAKARATAMKDSNRVEGRAAALLTTDIEPGTWNTGTRVFTPGAWATANAVRATARYSANWSLARIFGYSARTLRQYSVAAAGSASKSSCLKPFALPYTSLLQALGLPQDTTYRLTKADVNKLATMAPVTVQFEPNADGTVGGVAAVDKFYAVRYEPAVFADGSTGSPVNPSGATFADMIGDLSCTSGLAGAAGVGDELLDYPGLSEGNVKKGMDDLCGATCSRTITVPIWSGLPSGRMKILYMGTFQVTGSLKIKGKTNVVGYYTGLSVNGKGSGFSPTPGPMMKAVLVD